MNPWVLGKHLQLWRMLTFVFYLMGWENNVQRMKKLSFKKCLSSIHTLAVVIIMVRYRENRFFFLTLGFFFTLTELSLHKCIFFHLYLSNQNRCFKTYVDLCFFFLMGNTVFLITFPSERFCLIQRNKLFSENLIRLLNSSVCLWAMYLITHRYMQYVMWKQFSLDSIVAVTKVDFEIMSFHPRILRIAVYSLNWWYSSCIMQQCNLFM